MMNVSTSYDMCVQHASGGQHSVIHNGQKVGQSIHWVDTLPDRTKNSNSSKAQLFHSWEPITGDATQSVHWHASLAQRLLQFS
jgi:hypothetical protein